MGDGGNDGESRKSAEKLKNRFACVFRMNAKSTLTFMAVCVFYNGSLMCVVCAREKTASIRICARA